MPYLIPNTGTDGWRTRWIQRDRWTVSVPLLNDDIFLLEPRRDSQALKIFGDFYETCD